MMLLKMDIDIDKYDVGCHICAKRMEDLDEIIPMPGMEVVVEKGTATCGCHPDPSKDKLALRALNKHSWVHAQCLRK
jgi:hypothetical protein